MKIQRCKGMRDLLPPEAAKFHFISDVFRNSCLGRGYEEIKTPTLEYLHLFTSAGTLTSGMLNKVYSFLDWDGWSGERVVLKPDATIPVARLYIESMADKEPAKLFYLANVFIFEETGKKDREKWQCGTELIGAGSPIADVELMVMALEVVKRLGIGKVQLKLSHAGLTRGILQKIGLSPEEQNKLFDRILDGDTAALSRIKAEKPALAPLLALQGKSARFVKKLAAAFARDLPELKPQIDDFISIANLLQSLGFDYEIDVTSVRGFEYYTGVIFQLFAGDEKIGGGGRYDALIPAMGGKETPASGFALYMDTLMDMMKTETLVQYAAPKVLIKAEPEVVAQAFILSDSLRGAGLMAEMFLGGKEPKDAKWKLDYRKTAPQLALIDLIRNKKYQLQTADEVLTILQRDSGG